jgi:hypothetical protein
MTTGVAGSTSANKVRLGAKIAMSGSRFEKEPRA